ncbi:Nudix hydrolase [Actinidia chinensis var. chinensis]|uniref:NAD(+) diphosphatase n=1 Tax=Actinidia chinensis var. chinensis TaxID=1590841 RepID=A0A2R6S1W7_ACTCC|nr:Nudix hydrolase [Actinidia chinensis var. chinensis]
MLFLLSSLSTSPLLSLSKTLSLQTLARRPTMSINMAFHAFAGNSIKSKTPKSSDPFSPNSALQTLKSLILGQIQDLSSPNFRVLPFRKGRPLAGSNGGDSGPKWHLGWLHLGDCKVFLENSGVNLGEESWIFLGSKPEEDVIYWAIDVSEANSLVGELGSRQFCFVELRTLMVATDWSDERAMGDLAVAGHARALLEWHNNSHFCGHCGEKTIPKEAGRRRQCSSELCKKRIYPRVDPVVIMLVIDRENDCVLLSRQSRFVPRMWSCLAGFIEPGESLEEAVRRETWEETGIEVGEVIYHSSQPWPGIFFFTPGESLEEAVRRETWEETGIEVGEVIYHSSQPWPVGPNSMPCQLMVGFFAYAKSLEINVDKEELEDAQWHSREDVKKALSFAEYKKAQQTVAAKVDQMCKGVEKAQNLTADFNVESGELATMFIPGPFAIAHHLISSWVFQDGFNGVETHMKQPSGSLSNL